MLGESMKFVKEMSASEKKKILETLKVDGFKNIKDHGSYIEFCRGFREFRIYSTDLKDNELGVSVDFDFTGFLAEHYEIRTRHSVSLQDAIESQGSIEDACLYLEWRLERAENLQNRHSQWQADTHTDTIYEIKINEAPHVIINEEVYAGPIEPLLSMGKSTAEQLLAGTKILPLIKEF